MGIFSDMSTVSKGVVAGVLCGLLAYAFIWSYKHKGD